MCPACRSLWCNRVLSNKDGWSSVWSIYAILSLACRGVWWAYILSVKIWWGSTTSRGLWYARTLSIRVWWDSMWSMSTILCTPCKSLWWVPILSIRPAIRVWWGSMWSMSTMPSTCRGLWWASMLSHREWWCHMSRASHDNTIHVAFCVRYAHLLLARQDRSYHSTSQTAYEMPSATWFFILPKTVF